MGGNERVRVDDLEFRVFDVCGGASNQGERSLEYGTERDLYCFVDLHIESGGDSRWVPWINRFKRARKGIYDDL